MDSARAFERFFDEGPLPFEDSAHGAGHFGKWIVDADGNPAYEYEMDHLSDPRAGYFTSSGTCRDHWHLVGNDRIAATAHNGGYVQIYDWTRGGKILNRWEPSARQYSGGFRFVQMENEVFNTLWACRPKTSSQRRVFGMGYFEKETRYRDVILVERIEAPAGDDPVLLSTTVVENRGPTRVGISVVEFWGVNPYQLTPGPVMTHGLGRLFEWRRKRLNRRFVMDAVWEESHRALCIDFTPVHPERAPKPDAPSLVDYHLKTLFLAALDPLPPEFKAFVADADCFFGDGGLADPSGIRGAADGRLFQRRAASNNRAVLAIRRTLRLEPGDRVAFRYLYGYAPKDEIPRLAARQAQPVRQPRPPTLEWAAPEAPWLSRELVWHAYYLQAGVFYQEFYSAHFVDQGSAYGYLQGFSGAHRDFALFTLPMVYLRPALAREMLRFTMQAQDPNTGGLPYAHLGHGVITGAAVHTRSSDQDLFFLWALSEYLAAARDLGFLEEDVPFYPPSAGRHGAVLEHGRAAFRHLTERVGVGPHGLLRCGTGDWNDQTLAFSRCPPVTILRGESAFNAALATVALPALAGALEQVDKAFASELRAFAEGQARALEPLWQGDFAARGYLGYFNRILGGNRLFLDAQAFGVLGGIWDPLRGRRLFDRIRSDCVDPQKVGALCLWPPMQGPLLQAGSDTNGGTWAAIDSWAAWAWSEVDPKQAWDFYLTTTLAARAEAYPDIWYGIWSGPDSFNAHYHRRPGETFNVTVTPMTDFPVMNMNRHSGPLLDGIKLAGIKPRDGMIMIDPRVPFDSFVIRLPLIGAAYEPRRHRGYYTPVCSGTFHFAIRPPSQIPPHSARVTVEGRDIRTDVDDEGLVHFETQGIPEKQIRWEITGAAEQHHNAR